MNATHPATPKRPRRARHRGGPRPDGPLEPNSISTHVAAFIEPEQRHAMIADAAYFRAEHRGFDPGRELDDWLEAEREIDATLARGEPPPVI